MVAKRKSDIRPLRDDTPIYPIGVAARLLDVHPRTLRIYETEGLLAPYHKGSRRLYSPNDIKWVACLRSMIHEQGISIPGIKRLLALAPCWEIAECPAEVCGTCAARVDRSAPRSLRQVGDAVSEARAKEADQAARKGTVGKKQKATPK
jgi:MerR family transcriptional regulator/heat shock protein HspR